MSNFHTEVQTMTANKVVWIDEIKIDWLLDSGCTDHIINNDKYFSESIIFKEPVNVKIGDGKIFLATKLGYVIS